jgi:hypothetical protein
MKRNVALGKVGNKARVRRVDDVWNTDDKSLKRDHASGVIIPQQQKQNGEGCGLWAVTCQVTQQTKKLKL